MVCPCLQPDVGQSRERFLLVGHTVKVLRQHDIFERGEVGNQVELLEDETHFFGAGAVQVRGGNHGNILAVEPNFTASGTIQAADQVGESRFSRAGRAHDGQPFAGPNLQRDVIQRAHHASAFGLGRVETADMGKLDHFTLP